ncbi:unnamed protein product [Pocillopora meandrina]|uniref:Uncharacterized protein n=1 Tax=Pocillopora meandrina TaxID=46732 RepID=A0AAU9XKL0_9CNID|nr:unnamed protein product [Pocillopora meandrina]
MIVYQPLTHLMAARETREFITKLNESPVKDFSSLSINDSENGPAAYSLHHAGNEKYEDFIDGISTSLSRQ